MKLIDPRGEMLDPTWEAHASVVANADGPTELLKALSQLISNANIDLSSPSSVICGRDTRPSGEELNEAFHLGVNAMGGEAVKLVDLGIVTTPCVHYAVKARNLQGEERKMYGEPTLEGYLHKIAAAFNQLMVCESSILRSDELFAGPSSDTETSRQILQTGKSPSDVLTVDCANGVGFSAMKLLGPMIESSLPIRLICTDIEDATSLNYNCGADYVKTGQRLPPAMTDILKPGQRACSLDGDADRVVFYYLSGGADEAVRGSKSEGKFRLLDGDKIATLAAGFIGDLVRQAGLAERLKIGVVQTAYANGSSTTYLKKAVSIIIL